MSDYEEHAARVFDSRVQGIAERLRSLAEDVERRGRATESIRTLEPDYARAAAEVIHTLHWGLANMDLDGLVRAAGEADRRGPSSGGGVDVTAVEERETSRGWTGEAVVAGWRMECGHVHDRRGAARACARKLAKRIPTIAA